MDGWAFAAGSLAAVLLFEFAVFRYGPGDRAGRGRFDGGDSPDASGTGRASGSDLGATDRTTVDRSIGVDTDRTADGDGVRCPECGARNADAPTVVFCRDCIGRLD